MAKLTISWDKITDIFSAIKRHSQLKKHALNWIQPALLALHICPFRFRKPLLDRTHSLLKKGRFFSFFIYYHSHRKQLAKKRDNHDIMTRPMKRKSSQFMDNIDKRLK